jgi:hypothetical protein
MATMKSFNIPGGSEQATRRAERDNAYVRRNEVHGPSYRLEMSEQRHEGDPQQQLALREPDPYQRPMSVLDLIVAGAPRALPVSQEIQRGPEQSRSGEFQAAVQAAADLGHLHYSLGYRDRRWEGRRHRPTNNLDDLTPQDPPQRGGWQRDVPMERYLSY